MEAKAADARAQYSAIVLGGTGNVGARIVRLLIDSALCKRVVVVTRRTTSAFAHPKVSEVVVNMNRLEAEVAPHAQGADIAFVAFGVGKGSARMPVEEVRTVEVTYPQAFCRAARAGGARVCGLMTAAGADPTSRIQYARIIGEKEKAVAALGFDALAVFRPGLIRGNSNTPGILGAVLPLLDWAIPSRYHSIHKNDLARAMVAQSEDAFLAFARGEAPGGPSMKVFEYAEMKPLFVEGDRDAP
ncbi:MAG: NAD(P)H-binding protein [Vicinamibacterales bacterium]